MFLRKIQALVHVLPYCIATSIKTDSANAAEQVSPPAMVLACPSTSKVGWHQAFTLLEEICFHTFGRALEEICFHLDGWGGVC